MVESNPRVRSKHSPRLWHLGIIIVVFYIVLLGILLYVTYSQKYDFLQVAPIGGAIVGPTIAAFISIYLSVYSGQARITREQGRLTEIQIAEGVRKARQEHYETTVKFITDFFPMRDVNNTVTASRSNPLEVLRQYDLKKVSEMNNQGNQFVRHHIELEEFNSRKINFQDIVSLNERVMNYNTQLSVFDSLLDSKISEELADETTIQTGEEIQNPPRTGGKVSLKAARYTLKDQWKRCSEINKGELNKCASDFYPPTKVPDRNMRISLWSLETPNLLWSATPVSDADSLRINHFIFTHLRNVFVNKELFQNFSKLNELQYDIEDFVAGVNSICREISNAIVDKRYNKVAKCCPYQEIEITL